MAWDGERLGQPGAVYAKTDKGINLEYCTGIAEVMGLNPVQV